MNFLARLKTGLSKSSSRLSDGITGIFTKARLDDAAIESLEELLIEADMGAKVATELSAALAKEKFDKEVSPEEIRTFLATEIAKILQPYAVPLDPHPNPLPKREREQSGLASPSPSQGEGRGEGVPCVIMMVGVNGNGKTTTIGKLAQQFKAQGLSVMLAAADTFRAAAVEQLQVWGQRVQVPVITGAPESDPASVAFNALEKAKASGVDVLLIDTAGRLQNKENLMAELQKIAKVLKKIDDTAPHHVIQVLDATTGQNAISQVQAFKETAEVTGLIVTKLDGTAKGGVVVALARQFGLPIHAIGVGEAVGDLDAFEAIDFSENLLFLDH